MMEHINLSPSKLNDYNRCPRCFWIAQNHGIKPPRGIFSSLPGGMDRVIKPYFDQYRGTLPPELKGRVPGVLMSDMATLKRWRFWKTGPSITFNEHAVTLSGALDDCLIDSDVYIPWDTKTKGAKPKDNGAQYYQTQLDSYNLMLRENGHKIKDVGYLGYFFPIRVDSAVTSGDALKSVEHASCTFGVDIYRLDCSADRAKELTFKAAECLRGPIPTAEGCELCEYILMRQNAKILKLI